MKTDAGYTVLEERKPLRVEIMGSFRIQSAYGEMNEKGLHSRKGLKLLVYLLLHRNRTVSVQELEEAVWGEGKSDNPAGMLKNLVYRLRTQLKFLGQESFILSGQGFYAWNQSVKVQIDVERFEEAWERARQCEEKRVQERREDLLPVVEAYEHTVKCYGGPILEHLAEETWMLTLSTYYNSMYSEAVKRLASLYRQTGEYEKMTEICQRASSYDLLDEELHYWVAVGLSGQKKYQQALDYCEDARTLLKKRLGISSLDILEKAYAEILQTSRTAEKKSMKDVFQEVSEEEKPQSVFYCEYSIFRQIYRIEARRLERMGISEYIMLLTVRIAQKNLDEEQTAFIRRRAMERLREAICGSLRIGDVVCQYGGSQYIILLPICTYEDCERIGKRLTAKFSEKFRNPLVSMKYEMEEVSMTWGSIGEGQEPAPRRESRIRLKKNPESSKESV